MWYGTSNGLCRDDGYNIRVFRSDYLHPDVMSSNAIMTITEDKEGKIWFGTQKGAYILNKSSYTITPVGLEEISDKFIYYMMSTSDGSVWISIEGWLFRFRPDGKLINKYQMTNKGFPQYISFLIEDEKEGIIISKSWGGGLHRLNSGTDTFEPFCLNEEYLLNTCVAKDKKYGYYWLGSWNRGIVRFDPYAASEEMRYILQPPPLSLIGEPSTAFFSIVQDDVYGYLWVSAWDALYVYRITEEGMLEQVNLSGFSLSDNEILLNIIKDHAGQLWVSAFDRGSSFIIDFSSHEIKRYHLPELEERIKRKPAIIALAKDDKDIFWLSQERLGLCLYNSETGEMKTYKDYEQSRELRLWGIPLLIKSKEPGLMWAMQVETNIFGLKQNGMELSIEYEIDLKEHTETPGELETIFEDLEKNLWIGTTRGLFYFDTDQEKMIIVDNTLGHVTGITQTKAGEVWIAVKDIGLCKAESTGIIRVYPYRKDFSAMDIAEDELLWLGTGAGEVLTYDTKNEVWTDLTRSCGLNGDEIYKVLADRYQMIWIMTNQSLIKFNPGNKAYKRYGSRDSNISLNGFLPNSAYYDQTEDMLYFGGNSGFVSILPTQELANASAQVEIHISDIKIMGHSLWGKKESESSRIDQVVKVLPGEQNLEIEFSSLDYHHLNHIRYAYRLNGVDKDWIYLPEGKNSAIYNQLTKGKYQFEVKATDQNGLWSEKVTGITIHRLPAFYETWWAYLIYTLIVMVVVFLIYRTIRNCIILRDELLIKEVEKEKIEELNQAKLQFFTNITHELLTPLSIISASVDELKGKEPEEGQKYNVITSNTRRLIRLIQQILEFRKAESGNLRLKVSFGDLSAFMQKAVSDFIPLVQKQQLSIHLEQDEKVTGYFDTDKLDKIVYNLISN